MTNSPNIDETLRAKALELHAEAPLIDLHADSFSCDKDTTKFIGGWPEKHMDLPRMLSAGIWGEAFSLFVHPRWADGDEKGWLELAEMELENIHRAIEESEKLALATNSEEVLANAKRGQVSAIIEIEGLHPLSGDRGMDRVRLRNLKVLDKTTFAGRDDVLSRS
ncbi:MAG TPA: hypothetical protein ENN75_00600 [candidate division Zixibacteria bacterium]|nr:hypothetical protein [candidate division Zixibacteria bacterium]